MHSRIFGLIEEENYNETLKLDVASFSEHFSPADWLDRSDDLDDDFNWLTQTLKKDFGEFVEINKENKTFTLLIGAKEYARKTKLNKIKSFINNHETELTEYHAGYLWHDLGALLEDYFGLYIADINNCYTNYDYALSSDYELIDGTTYKLFDAIDYHY